MRTAVALALSALAFSAAAQDFPAGARSPSAEELQKTLADKVFDVKLANGNSWRLEYKSSGYFFINVSNGFSDSGKWKPESGRLCQELRKVNAGCNDVRLVADALFMKRDSGEIIEFVPRR